MSRLASSSYVLALVVLLSACGEAPRPPSGHGGDQRSASVEKFVRGGESGLIPAGPVVVPVDQAGLRDAKPTRLCAVDVVNGQRASDPPVELDRSRQASFRGWILSPDRKVPESFALLLVGQDDSYAVQVKAGVPRPDVARRMKSPDAGYAGYVASVGLEGVEPGEYVLALLQDTKRVVTQCETRFRVVVK